MRSSKMPTPPVPFAIDKCYGSKSSVYGTQNKIRCKRIRNKVHCNINNTCQIQRVQYRSYQALRLLGKYDIILCFQSSLESTRYCLCCNRGLATPDRMTGTMLVLTEWLNLSAGHNNIK